MALVFLDIDGTLTEVASPWQDIHEHNGLWLTRGIPILEDWLEGRISYDEFCHRDVSLWNEIGLSLEEIHQRFDRYPLRPQTRQTIRSLHEAGHTLVLLSSGFTYIGRRVLAECGEEIEATIIANDLHVQDGRLTVTVHVSGDTGSGRSKADHVQRICKERKIGPEETYAIGDGPSDQQMFDACGKGFLVHGNEDLLTAAHKINGNQTP